MAPSVPPRQTTLHPVAEHLPVVLQRLAVAALVVRRQVGAEAATAVAAATAVPVEVEEGAGGGAATLAEGAEVAVGAVAGTAKQLY